MSSKWPHRESCLLYIIVEVLTKHYQNHNGQKIKLTAVLFYKENVPGNKSLVSLASLCDCCLEFVDYFRYSLDLFLPDYHLPSNMQKHLERNLWRWDDFFFLISWIKPSTPLKSKPYNTERKIVFTVKWGPTIKYKSHFVIFYEIILFKILIFQPNLVVFSLSPLA